MNKIQKETSLIIEGWCKEFDIEKTWVKNLHIADVLDKHVFPALKDKLTKTQKFWYCKKDELWVKNYLKCPKCKTCSPLTKIHNQTRKKALDEGYGTGWTDGYQEGVESML